MNEVSLSVSEVHSLLNKTLTKSMGTLWVTGELLSVRANGAHLYLELVERKGPGRQVSSLLNLVMLAPQLRTIRHKLHQTPGVELSVGVPIRVRGALNTYEPRGSLSFKVDDIDPTWTLGKLVADKDAVLRKIIAEGLDKKQALQRLVAAPLKVALLTSPGSAAEADFIDELRKSGIGFQVLSIASQVQGEDAPRQLEMGLRRLQALKGWTPDVAAVVRGGGSKNDLAAYDTEVVARAIANAPWPVITGIGHEIDRSVADEVAFAQFKTPTAAAHALVNRVRAYHQELENKVNQVERGLVERLQRIDVNLQRAQARSVHAAGNTLSKKEMMLDAKEEKVLGRSRHLIERAEVKLIHQDRTLQRLGSEAFTQAERFLDQALALVQAASPQRALSRGFSITRFNGKVILDASSVPERATIETELSNGTLTSEVKK